MSQPLPLVAGAVDDPGQPLTSIDACYDYFLPAHRPREQFLVGTEHEQFGSNAQNRPLQYQNTHAGNASDPSPSIFEALQFLHEHTQTDEQPWQTLEEAGALIALYRPMATVSLEPGAQLELSGAPFTTMHETAAELRSYLSLLTEYCRTTGAHFAAMGFHPTASWHDLPLVPKSRYGIMQAYMPTRGQRGRDMMKRTCTVQANMDFSDENDMRTTVQAGLVIAPIVSALFASSPLYEGKHRGVVSERMMVWRDTDPDRWGFPDVMLADNFSYQTWTQHALDVPMYFVRRNGISYHAAGASFRTFMTEGLHIDGLGHVRATLRDFADHLTTLFTEVRLKRVIELRGADCGPEPMLNALPSLWTGLLYDVDVRAQVISLMDKPTSSELLALQGDVAKNGLRAVYRGKTVQSLAERLFDLATAGLQKRSHVASSGVMQGNDESYYLYPLRKIIERGETLSEWLLRHLQTDWQGDVDALRRAVSTAGAVSRERAQFDADFAPEYAK